jgi:Domain of unknown function (DUF4396)
MKDSSRPPSTAAVSMSKHSYSAQQQSLNGLAFSATVHCLTGCAIGEVLGMILSTWWGWGNVASIVLSVALAFLFGYGLTSLPLLRSGMSLRQVTPLAFASDTGRSRDVDATRRDPRAGHPAAAPAVRDRRGWTSTGGRRVSGGPLTSATERHAGTIARIRKTAPGNKGRPPARVWGGRRRSMLMRAPRCPPDAPMVEPGSVADVGSPSGRSCTATRTSNGRELRPVARRRRAAGQSEDRRVRSSARARPRWQQLRRWRLNLSDQDRVDIAHALGSVRGGSIWVGGVPCAPQRDSGLDPNSCGRPDGPPPAAPPVAGAPQIDESWPEATRPTSP